MTRTIIDNDAARELELYTENTSRVYNRSTVSTIENLRKKYSKGQYDKEKAVKAWEYVAEYAAKEYCKEFAERSAWHIVFNAATRREVAKYLEYVYFGEYIKGAE